MTEVKTVPYVPLSHPFVERLIGTVRREYLDQVPYEQSEITDRKIARLDDYRWEKRCRGLYQLPAAA